jgi:hypothetical protein
VGRLRAALRLTGKREFTSWHKRARVVRNVSSRAIRQGSDTRALQVHHGRNRKSLISIAAIQQGLVLWEMIMKGKLLTSALVLLVAGTLRAQQGVKFAAGGGDPPDDRASARLLYWNKTANQAAGQIAFNYGRPVWRKDYEDPARFDAITKGKVWRMGSNFWSNLYTDLPITISGKSIKPGLYFLGLQRSADGSSWSLAFIDPVKVRKSRLDAFQIERATIEFTAPMNTEVTGSDTVEKLTIVLTGIEKNPKNVTLRVSWGHLALSAPVNVTVGE